MQITAYTSNYLMITVIRMRKEKIINNQNEKWQKSCTKIEGLKAGLQYV